MILHELFYLYIILIKLNLIYKLMDKMIFLINWTH